MLHRSEDDGAARGADGRAAAGLAGGAAGPPEPGRRGSCAWPGCSEDGSYRAPRSRRREDGFHAFCLAHVRDYNAAWDFFAGMTPEQIAAYRNEDVTWHRPTWRLGAPGGGGGSWIRDDLDVFAAAFGVDGSVHGTDPQRAERPMKPGERAALKLFGLDQHASLHDIKVRYKQLAKRYHPDATGGDKRSEDRFKAVTRAYRYLLACGYA
ncbi:MAG: J domain-containing protein [Acetobacterales bacterium]